MNIVLNLKAVKNLKNFTPFIFPHTLDYSSHLCYLKCTDNNRFIITYCKIFIY